MPSNQQPTEITESEMKDGGEGQSDGGAGGTDLFSCEHCDSSFVTKWSLDSHMKGFHPQPKVNNPTPPPAQNTSQQALGKKLPRKNLQQQQQPDQDYIRIVRGKEAVKPLLLSPGETAVKAFPCQLCNKDFSQQEQLTVHLKSAHSEVTITIATPPKPKPRMSLLKRPLEVTGHKEEGKLKIVKMEPKPKPSISLVKIAPKTQPQLHQIQIDGNFEINEVVRTLLISHMNAESGREAEAAAAAKKLTHILPSPSLNTSTLVQSPMDNRNESDEDDEFEGEGSDDSRFDGGSGHHIFPEVTLEEDPNGEFQCSECGASFHTPYKLERHMEQHNLSNRPFKCHLCGDSRGFVRKEHLTKHMSSVHSGMKFTCEICGKDISRRDHLVRHLRSVHRCSIPPGLDLIAASSASHVQLTANSPAVAVPATIMQLQLDEISDKALQSMQPKPKKPYTKCDMCEETFTQLETLFKHQRHAHSDIRKYNCDLCTKSFKRREHLQKHVILHTGEKKFTCEFCSRSFPRRDALQDHLRRIHGAIHPTDAEEFPCSLCDKVFLQNSNLVRHRNQVHNITLAVAIANGGPISRDGTDASSSDDGMEMDKLMMRLLGNQNCGSGGSTAKVKPPVPGLLPIENFHFQPTTAGRN